MTGNARQAYDLALAGAVGAVFGLYLDVELVRVDSVWVRDACAGAAIGGAIGYCLNASGPLRDGAWLALARAASWGAIAGAAGGALGLVVGEAVLGGLKGGLAGRAAGWAVLGLGIGASQGLAARSTQKLAFGLIGGGLGGLVGGASFEVLRDAFGNRYDLGQGLGIALLGGGLGLGLAVVEQALRRAWVVVLSGRQEGRSYLLARRVSIVGLDERAEVGLFGDPLVARLHARIEATPAGFVLTSEAPPDRTKVDGQAVVAPRILEDGDRIEIGRTLILFRRR